MLFFPTTNLDQCAVKMQGMAVVLRDQTMDNMAAELEKMAVMLMDISNEAKAEYALQEQERKDDKE